MEEDKYMIKDINGNFYRFNENQEIDIKEKTRELEGNNTPYEVFIFDNIYGTVSIYKFNPDGTCYGVK